MLVSDSRYRLPKNNRQRNNGTLEFLVCADNAGIDSVFHERRIRFGSAAGVCGTTFCFTWKGNSALLASENEISKIV